MTNEEILAGNTLIAQFMGYKIKSISDTTSYGNGDTFYLYSKNEVQTDQVFYDNDWNWLMSTVEKISMINHGNKNGQRYLFNTSRCAKHCINENDKPIKIRIKGVTLTHPSPFIEINSFNELNGTWLAVIEFIKWYNTQNK